MALFAFVSIALATAFPARGQDTNARFQPATILDGFEPKPAARPSTDTNREPKTPPSSNSIAFQQTTMRAEKGDAAAQRDLGLMYDQAQGVAQNYAKR